MWDVDGNEYIDYHAAFGVHLLGYGCEPVVQAVRNVLENHVDLVGTGATELEGELAELIADNIPHVERAVFLNTGSEATAHAIRLARSYTGKDHIIVMQGGYNGWHNDVACNLLTPLSSLGPRRHRDEYPFIPISAGIPAEHQRLVHIVNFNDLESVDSVCQRWPVGALITEPVLQNVGVIKPLPGYLAGLKELSKRYEFALIFDEVKTGFRSCFGSYASIEGVEPDLVVYGKAVASGYPLGVLGGHENIMSYFETAALSKRVLLAGTYNAHPVVMAAAIATLRLLLDEKRIVYARLDAISSEFEISLTQTFEDLDGPATVCRAGSAFALYFMDHAPRDWHDILEHHDFDLDKCVRERLIEKGIYWFPLATKQVSISAAHTQEDIQITLERIRNVVDEIAQERTSALQSARVARLP